MVHLRWKMDVGYMWTDSIEFDGVRMWNEGVLLAMKEETWTFGLGN